MGFELTRAKGARKKAAIILLLFEVNEERPLELCFREDHKLKRGFPKELGIQLVGPDQVLQLFEARERLELELFFGEVKLFE